jgi:large subunit ribosomal protein L23
MMEARDIVIRPIVTEKSSNQMLLNRYTFVVHKKANKIQIKDAIEEIFKVKVLDVNTINYVGKLKRVGRSVGRRSDWKKAVVTLRDGDSIEIFEGL